MAKNQQNGKKKSTPLGIKIVAGILIFILVCALAFIVILDEIRAKITEVIFSLLQNLFGEGGKELLRDVKNLVFFWQYTAPDGGGVFIYKINNDDINGNNGIRTSLINGSVEMDKIGMDSIMIKEMDVVFNASKSTTSTLVLAQLGKVYKYDAEGNKIKGDPNKDPVDDEGYILEDDEVQKISKPEEYVTKFGLDGTEEGKEIIKKYKDNINTVEGKKIGEGSYAVHYFKDDAGNVGKLFWFEIDDGKFNETDAEGHEINNNGTYLGAYGVISIKNSDGDEMQYRKREDLDKMIEDLQKTKTQEEAIKEAIKNSYGMQDIGIIYVYNWDGEAVATKYQYRNEGSFTTPFTVTYSEISEQTIRLEDLLDYSKFTIPIELTSNMLNLTGSNEFADVFLNYALKNTKIDINLYEQEDVKTTYLAKQYDIEPKAFFLEIYNFDVDQETFNKNFKEIVFDRKYKEKDIGIAEIDYKEKGIDIGQIKYIANNIMDDAEEDNKGINEDIDETIGVLKASIYVTNLIMHYWYDDEDKNQYLKDHIGETLIRDSLKWYDEETESVCLIDLIAEEQKKKTIETSPSIANVFGDVWVPLSYINNNPAKFTYGLNTYYAAIINESDNISGYEEYEFEDYDNAEKFTKDLNKSFSNLKESINNLCGGIDNLITLVNSLEKIYIYPFIEDTDVDIDSFIEMCNDIIETEGEGLEDGFLGSVIKAMLMRCIMIYEAEESLEDIKSGLQTMLGDLDEYITRKKDVYNKWRRGKDLEEAILLENLTGVENTVEAGVMYTVTETKINKKTSETFIPFVTNVSTWYSETKYNPPTKKFQYTIKMGDIKEVNGTEYDNYDIYNQYIDGSNSIDYSRFGEYGVDFGYNVLRRDHEPKSGLTGKKTWYNKYEEASPTNDYSFESYIIKNLAEEVVNTGIAYNKDYNESSTHSDYVYAKYDKINLRAYDGERSKIESYEMGTIITQTQEDKDEKIKKFLALLKNEEGTIDGYTNGFDSNGKIVEYEDFYLGKAKVGDLLENGAEMFFQLLESSPSTAGFVNIFKYIMYIYTGTDYGITSPDFFTTNETWNYFGDATTQYIMAWENSFIQGYVNGTRSYDSVVSKYITEDKKYYKAYYEDISSTWNFSYGINIGGTEESDTAGGDYSMLFPKNGLNKPSEYRHEDAKAEVEKMDKVYKDVINSHKNKVINTLNDAGITLSDTQIDALVSIKYQYGNIDGFNTAWIASGYGKDLNKFKNTFWVSTESDGRAYPFTTNIYGGREQANWKLFSEGKYTDSDGNEIKMKAVGDGDIMEIAEEVHTYMEDNNYTYEHTNGVTVDGMEKQRVVNCISFVTWVYCKAGYISEIYTSCEEFENAINGKYKGKFEKISSYSQLQPGDIMYFGNSDHAEIYAGDGYSYNAGSNDTIHEDAPRNTGVRNFSYGYRIKK